jgi:hypothetical protein
MDQGAIAGSFAMYPAQFVRAFGALETINRVRAVPIEDLPWTSSLA